MALGSLFPKLALIARRLGSSVSLRAGRKNDFLPETVRPEPRIRDKSILYKSNIGFAQGMT
jgi:hypothetical protein